MLACYCLFGVAMLDFPMHRSSTKPIRRFLWLDITKIGSPPPLSYSLLAALLLVSVGSAHAFETKVETEKSPLNVCFDGYKASSASNTCGTVAAEIVVNDMCKLTYTCQTQTIKAGEIVNRSSTITINPEDADDLYNCDGWLQIGSC